MESSPSAPKGAPRPVVFVVDDDVSVRESLELLIRTAGWVPQIFTCARDFLARAPVRAPGCLVLDVHLPDLNGLDLQQRVAVDRNDLPIILITGYGDVPMAARSRAGLAAERRYSSTFQCTSSDLNDGFERLFVKARRGPPGVAGSSEAGTYPAPAAEMLDGP
jgi:CheY-like chemotaxis protein